MTNCPTLWPRSSPTKTIGIADPRAAPRYVVVCGLSSDDVALVRSATGSNELHVVATTRRLIEHVCVRRFCTVVLGMDGIGSDEVAKIVQHLRSSGTSAITIRVSLSRCSAPGLCSIREFVAFNRISVVGYHDLAQQVDDIGIANHCSPFVRILDEVAPFANSNAFPILLAAGALGDRQTRCRGLLGFSRYHLGRWSGNSRTLAL